MARDGTRTAGSDPPLLFDMSGDTEPRPRRVAADAIDRLASVDRLLAATPLIVALVDREGVLRFVSDAVRRVLHREPAELLGRRVAELVHRDDAARSGGSRPGECWCREMMEHSTRSSRSART